MKAVVEFGHLIDRIMPPHTQQRRSAAELLLSAPCSCCSISAPAWSRHVAMQQPPSQQYPSQQPPAPLTMAAAVGHLLLHLTKIVIGLWEGLEGLSHAGSSSGSTSRLSSSSGQLASLHLQLARQLLCPQPPANRRSSSSAHGRDWLPNLPFMIIKLTMPLVLGAVVPGAALPIMSLQMQPALLYLSRCARVLQDHPAIKV